MRCFYHQEKEAIAVCKSCGKALCPECAVDLGKGLACRNRCEADVRGIIELIERSIQSVRSPGQMSLRQSLIIESPDKEAKSSVILNRYIQSSRKHLKMFATFTIAIGIIFIVAAITKSGNLLLHSILGLCFFAFGVVLIRASQEPKKIAQKQTTQTSTRPPLSQP